MAGQCEHCDYIGACPYLESGDCEGGPHSFMVEDGRVYMLTEMPADEVPE